MATFSRAGTRCTMVLLSLNSFAFGLSIERPEWVHLQEKDRTAFVTGYLNCLDWAKRPSYPTMSNRALGAAITQYFDNHPNEDKSVGIVLKQLGGLTKHTPAPNEETGYSGDYWYQISSQERRSYVQGFTSCATDEHVLSFSKTPDVYVQAISKFYGLTADGEDMDLKRAIKALQDVLASFKDDQNPVNR